MLFKASLGVLLAVIIYLYCQWVERQPLPGPTFHTVNGIITSNVMKSREGREYFEILGIPYAKSPEGDLRFEPPQPPEDWYEQKDGTKFGNECIQYNLLTKEVYGAEDCLFLNVFLPRTEKSRTEFLPVIVFFHLGWFVSGSSNYFGAKYLMDEDVILVTVNYRLNIFGFLSTNDSVVTGNMGLKDQVMALKWVQQNIQRFGGDRSRVTLMGGSAGGASVTFHLISEMSQGLFTNGIAHSGNALSSWAVQTNPTRRNSLFATRVNCTIKNNHKFLQCLKKLDAYRIAKELSKIREDDMSQEYFFPVVEPVEEGAFLATTPENHFITPKHKLRPMIFGFTRDEGFTQAVGLMSSDEGIKNFTMKWYSNAPKKLSRKLSKQKLKKIKEFYFPHLGHELVDDLEILKGWSNLFSDNDVIYESTKFIELYRKHGDICVYYFNYGIRDSFSVVVEASSSGGVKGAAQLAWTYFTRWFKRKFLGQEVTSSNSCNSDDLLLLFNTPVASEIDWDHQDYQMSKQLVKTWVEFATLGNSFNSANFTFDSVNWVCNGEGQKEDLKYLMIKKFPEMIQQPLKERMNFWKNLNI